jgi:hypothetical protein
VSATATHQEADHATQQKQNERLNRFAATTTATCLTFLFFLFHVPSPFNLSKLSPQIPKNLEMNLFVYS